MTSQMHHVPGRLRVRVPVIKRSHEKAALLEQLLREAPGVRAAEPNLATGSVVVRYDPQSTSAALILATLIDRGYLQSAPVAPPPVETPAATRIRNKIAQAIFWYCLEAAIERSLPLLLAALL